MEKAKVYFTDLRVGPGTNLMDKLQKLMRRAGIGTIDMDGRFVAIKMHFGEWGNLSFLRPNYARAVADVVKEQGGKPFLTDCNTLYPGYRKNALDHLDCANMNGFNPMTTGCQVIIADGLRGTDDIEVPVEGGEYIKKAYIGRAVMDADVFISLTHFKGHEAVGFGGTLKNIGMGCGSRGGKMDQHSSGKPEVDEALCRGCRRCAKECGSDAITYEGGKAHIHLDLCKGCGRCVGACAFDAISPSDDSANDILGCKIAEYAKAVCSGRRISISRWRWISARTVTAIPRMTRQSCPISACSRPLIRWRWIRPVWMPAKSRHRCRIPSCRTICPNRAGSVTMSIFWTAIRMYAGKKPSPMRRRSVWGQEHMIWKS